MLPNTASLLTVQAWYLKLEWLPALRQWAFSITSQTALVTL
jgi:hypothetical protein